MWQLNKSLQQARSEMSAALISRTLMCWRFSVADHRPPTLRFSDWSKNPNPSVDASEKIVFTMGRGVRRRFAPNTWLHHHLMSTASQSEISRKAEKSL